MARINIEESIFADIRFRTLARHLEDDDRAIGMLVRAWLLAQKYWIDDHQLVPKKVWDAAGLAPLLTVDLAEIRDGKVYCRGSEKQFDWLVKANRIAAGKRSAKVRREKYGTAIPASASNLPKKVSEQTPNKTELAVRTCSDSVPEHKPNKTELSYSLYAEETRDNLPPMILHPEDASAKASARKPGDVWKAYEAAYYQRYGHTPVKNGKQMGICGQLVKRLGGDAAIQVVRFYLTHDDAFYIRKAHALGLCLQDAEALHTQMKTGKKINSSSAYHADKSAAQRQVFEDVTQRLREKGLLDDK